MTKEEIQKVEDLVNEQIKRDLEVKCEEMTYEEAKNSGAIGLFTDKYGEKVKVYTIGDFSKEICGGPHVTHTGNMGTFKIKKKNKFIRSKKNKSCINKIIHIYINDNCKYELKNFKLDIVINLLQYFITI